MEPKTFQEAAYLVAKETADLVIKKQKDYGPDNIVALGELGIFVRLWDKINRLLTLLWRPLLAGHPPKEARNEPAEDTWDDIPGYCLCRKMLKRGWFTLPMEESKSKPCPECGEDMVETATNDVMDYVGRKVGEWAHLYCPTCEQRAMQSRIIKPLPEPDSGQPIDGGEVFVICPFCHNDVPYRERTVRTMHPDGGDWDEERIVYCSYCGVLWRENV